jgi:type II secretory pathway pseudopilin PulG
MSRRRGFTLLEAFAAAAVLGGLMIVCVKFFTASAAQQEAMRDRSRAIQLAANVMERLAGEPWDQLTAEKVRPLQDAEDLRQSLPECRIEIQITQPSGEPDGKQIAVLVRWPSRADAAQRPVRLVGWRYRPVAK